MQRRVFIEADIENNPLEIMTDSSLDSDEKVSLSFYTSGGDSAGGVILHLSSPPQYELDDCTFSNTDFPTELPNDTNKVWRISLIKTPGIRLVIHCNEVEVLNILLSDKTCFDWWSFIWNKKVEKLKFNGNDLASDYYTGLLALDNSRL